MARPAGLEPATIRLEGGCSIQLSYGRLSICILYGAQTKKAWYFEPYGDSPYLLTQQQAVLDKRGESYRGDFQPSTRKMKKISDIKGLRENPGGAALP
jgi:hypothetical protein